MKVCEKEITVTTKGREVRKFNTSKELAGPFLNVEIKNAEGIVERKQTTLGNRFEETFKLDF